MAEERERKSERPRRRWFRTHVTGFFLGVPAIVLGLVNGWGGVVTVGGVALALSGVASITARRSILVSHGARPVLDAERPGRRRAAAEHVNAWMSGIVLTALGLVLAMAGTSAWLR